MLSESAIHDLRKDILNELKRVEEEFGIKDNPTEFIHDCLIPNKTRLEYQLEILNQILEIENKV